MKISLVGSLLAPLLLFYLVGYLVEEVDAAKEVKTVQEIKDFVTKHCVNEKNQEGKDACTAFQIQQYLKDAVNESVLFEEFPRLFPYCVTSELFANISRVNETDFLFHFKGIFEKEDFEPTKFYNFNKTLHSVLENREWIDEVKIERINTPEMDMVNLRQWLHLEIHAAKPLKGLYVQSIVGPFGLPFGEFNLDFPCQDKPSTADIDKVGQLAHCAYRPRAAIYHPTVYVGYDTAGRAEWHMHFLWTDITCYEMPYAQFLILAVRDFAAEPVRGVSYNSVYSPVYLNTNFDSKSGAPFPYYPSWKDKMYCYQDNMTFNATYAKYGTAFPSQKNGSDPLFDDLKWTIAGETARVQASEVYDACLTGVKKEYRDDDRLECPPGPFQCTESYGATTEEKVKESRLKLVTAENKLSDCAPCVAPECLDLGFPIESCNDTEKTIENVFHDSDRIEVSEKQNRIKSHGVVALLSFLVLQPLANYMGRFFKELCPDCLCGNGPWIFIHILMHALALMFSWMSLGPVTTESYKEIKNRCELEHSIPENSSQAIEERHRKNVRACVGEHTYENPHLVFGLCAVIFQHLVLLCAFCRSASNKLRNIQVALHSHMGYLTFIFGGVSAFTALGNKCADILTIQMMLFITPLVFSGVAIAIDCMVDKRVGIIPPRKQWPTLEPVVLQGRAPFAMIKWILFTLLCCLQFVFWIMAVVGANIIASKIQELLAGNTTSGISLEKDKEYHGATYRGYNNETGELWFDLKGIVSEYCRLDISPTSTSAGHNKTGDAPIVGGHERYFDYEYEYV